MCNYRDRVEREEGQAFGARLRRYCQMLWIGFSSHAATFSSIPSTSFPFLNFAPALTKTTK